MLTIIIVLLLLFIAFLLLAIINGGDSQNERSQEMEKILNNEQEFTATQKIVGMGNRYIFAVDETRRKILFVKELNLWKYIREHRGEKIDERNKPDLYPKVVIPFEQIINVSIVENSTIIAQKSSLRTIGGAVAGGVLGGGAGAIVGGLSGDVKQKKDVKELQVEIKLRDINNPSLTIECYNARNLDSLEQGKEDAKRIADIVGVIIDDVDKSSSNSAIPVNNNISVADEILKLSRLKEQGILTEEEFEAQKCSLLNRY